MIQPSNLAFFDPHSLTLVRGLTVYSDFHEHAHAEQHCRQTLAWRARQWFAADKRRRWLGLGPLVELTAEIEAALIARRGMLACGLWDERDRREALQGIFSYAATLLTEG